MPQVVGSKMPQYRLFGDTVDVAGMMTITGEGGWRERERPELVLKYLAVALLFLYCPWW